MRSTIGLAAGGSVGPAPSYKRFRSQTAVTEQRQPSSVDADTVPADAVDTVARASESPETPQPWQYL